MTDWHSDQPVDETARGWGYLKCFCIYPTHDHNDCKSQPTGNETPAADWWHHAMWSDEPDDKLYWPVGPLLLHYLVIEKGGLLRIKPLVSCSAAGPGGGEHHDGGRTHLRDDLDLSLSLSFSLCFCFFSLCSRCLCLWSALALSCFFWREASIGVGTGLGLGLISYERWGSFKKSGSWFVLEWHKTDIANDIKKHTYMYQWMLFNLVIVNRNWI